jgi:D-tyrosyl-tRNA(Tyr) deacylase
VQRVKSAAVTAEGRGVGAIGPGLLVFLGVGQADEGKDLDYLLEKIPALRIFEDEAGKMNLSLLETGGEILVVSQFTLYADTRKGRRPSFIQAAPLEKANAYYEDFAAGLRQRGIAVATGQFQAHMEVSLVNDGPVTIFLDTAGN